MRKLIMIFMILCMCTYSVLANSAQTSWTGTTSTGAIIKEGDSPIVVNHENLVLTINQLPQVNHQGVYQANVVAEYELYNPSDLTIKTNLLFPFGELPSYIDEDEGLLDYAITVDGEAIKKVIRHTFQYNQDSFTLEDSLEKIIDGYKDDVFYKRDLPVTKYTYLFKNIEYDNENNPCASLELLEEFDKYRVLSNDISGTRESGEYLHLRFDVENDSEVVIYILGDHSDVDFKWDIFQTTEEKKAINGDVVLKEEEKMTFEEFAMTCFEEESQILPHDWYNAFVDMLNHNENGLLTFYPWFNFDITNELMRWYEYTLTIDPNSSVIHTVTAPLYPSINERYEPAIYAYDYLLSPAKSWASFGTLKIEVNTPYYMIDSSISEMSKTEQGYVIHLNGLPDTELEFTLCEEESPEESLPKVSVTFMYIGIYLVGILVIGSIILKKIFSRHSNRC